MAYKVANRRVLQMYCVLFLILSGFITCSCADIQTHDIYPETTYQSWHNECLTLSDILNERDKFFASDSMLVFHEGEHILQGEVVFVSNISNFILLGYSGSGSGLSSPTITCVNSSLFFSDVSIAITSIALNRCSISLSHAAAVVQDSRFENGSAVDGGALAALYSSVQFHGANSFTGNMAERYGGAIYAEQSTLTFSGSTIFAQNTAQHGGAVYCGHDTSLNFSGSSLFMKNTAEQHSIGVFTLRRGGAVYAWYNNIVSFNGDNRFMSNAAEWDGGAVYAWDTNTLSFNGNSSFVSNTAKRGGAVFVEENNTLRFIGNISFMSNAGLILYEAIGLGSAVCAWVNNTLSFNGNSSFMNNTAGWGGAVYAVDSNTMSFDGNSSFMSNTAGYFGGAVYVLDSNTLSFNGNSSFMNNTAHSGGAVSAYNNNTLSFNGNISFMSNAADVNGGAVCALHSNTLGFSGNSKFRSNMAEGDGGAVYIGRSSLSYYGSSIIEHNEAARGGGIAIFLNSQVHLFGTTSLLFNIASFGGGAFVQDSSIDCICPHIEVIENEAEHGGGLFIQLSEITLQSTGLLAGNTATNPEGGYGGAIFSRSSILKLQGSFDINNNTAGFGGGLAFFGVYDGVLTIKDGTNLNFEGNFAHKRGGAIYVEDDPFTFCAFDNETANQVNELCFFQRKDGPHDCFSLPYKNDPTNSITLKFNSNTANVSGDIMYGGHLDSCVVCGEYSYTFGAETFYHYAESKTDVHVFSKLSSDPYKVCICEDSHPNCDLREVNRTVYPGQVLVTSVVAVGQMNGTVPSVIRAVCDDLIGNPDFQETQPAENSKQCSQLQYPLFSRVPSTTLKLYSDEPCSTSGYPLTFLIKFRPCPVGFTLSEQGACICDERLQKYTQNCSIRTLTISRNADDSFWVGVEGSEKLILHPHCPSDYCIEEPAHFPLNSTDMQCANGRSGIMCGGCQPGRGLALGSSRCLSDCSNKFLALLLAFAIAGVALVAFLFLCHLTVAKGTLSGLIFYANILAVNQTVFFPSGEQNLLTVFIAWLNLDLGIETCFFVDLDAYYRTWLQFAFPIYIWLMVGAIIVLADRSIAFAKFIGSTNPVAVLATLFLLSYAKLLRAIMAAFSFTSLDYPDGDNKYVWLYDGNTGYLDRHDGRHIALFLFSLLFLLFVFLPYTLLLLCGQWIQKQLWWLSSTKQLYLKFFLDAHYGPYKNQHSYWTGLLLLLRFLMLFVATITNINNPQDPYSKLLVIFVVSSSLILWGWFVRGFYKKWYHDILEGLFNFNLVVLAGATLQVRQSGGNQAGLVYASVSIAFVTFIGIVLSAVMPRVKRKLPDHLRTAIRHRFTRNNQNQNDKDDPVPTAFPMTTVTYSVVEIDHKESGNAECETELITSQNTDQ